MVVRETADFSRRSRRQQTAPVVVEIQEPNKDVFQTSTVSVPAVMTPQRSRRKRQRGSVISRKKR
jgi:hypothetical protein